MYTLPKLNYSYKSLEPHIDAKTMEIHHSKHHQGYVDKLNAAFVSHPDLQKIKVEKLLQDLDQLPKKIQAAVQNNGGGHANHSLFWQVISPQGGGEPPAKLLTLLTNKFGSLKKFKTELSNLAATQFGSGWGWLVVNSKGGLEIMSTSNQDSPLSQGLIPIMNIDVWEHAYYLKYQNRRADYLEAFWKVVDWAVVEKKYLELAK